MSVIIRSGSVLFREMSARMVGRVSQVMLIILQIYAF